MIMRVNIDDLGRVLFSLLQELKDKKGCEIELENDFYWDIDSEELYNPYKKPKHMAYAGTQKLDH